MSLQKHACRGWARTDPRYTLRGRHRLATSTTTAWVPFSACLIGTRVSRVPSAGPLFAAASTEKRLGSILPLGCFVSECCVDIYTVNPRHAPNPALGAVFRTISLQFRPCLCCNNNRHICSRSLSLGVRPKLDAGSGKCTANHPSTRWGESRERNGIVRPRQSDASS
jgi:hypothetical protein